MTGERSPLEVFADHGTALLSGRVEAIAEDYAPACAIMLPGRRFEGRSGVLEFFSTLLAALPEPQWTAVSTAAYEDVVLHEWSVTSERHRVDDGIDTLLVRGGLIQVQTVRYTLVPHTAGEPAAGALED